MRVVIREDTITATLKKLQEHLNVPKLARSIANIALAAVQRNFIAGGRSKSGAGGTWPPLAQSTLLMRRQGKGSGGTKTLQDTRALMNGIHPEFIPKGVTIATAGQPYDAIQHFGGVTRPRVTLKSIAFMWGQYTRTLNDMFAAIASKAPMTKLNVVIPPRPYLMLTDPDRQEISDLVLNFKPGVAQ